MKNNISSHYLLNRYSYCLYFLVCAVFLARLKLNGWVFVKDEIVSFGIITFFYLLWIFVYGTFHFREQAKVSRVDYQTLKFAKGARIAEITKSDIAQIYIQKITNAKMRGLRYKVLVITKDGEKFRFTYVSRVSNSASTDLVDDFLSETENFWGLGDRSIMQLSPDVFFCN